MKNIAQLTLTIATLATCVLLTSCATSKPVSHRGESSPQRVSSKSSWYRVKDNPPVFYPVGISKDAITDYRHGDWIAAGEDGALYFVPFSGSREASADELTRQAFAMKTEEQQSAIRRENVRQKAFATIGTTALTTLTLATTAAQATSSYGAAQIDPAATWSAHGNSLDQSPFLGVLDKVRFRERLYDPASVAKASRGPSRPGARANEDQSISSLNREADAILLEDARQAVNANSHAVQRPTADAVDPASIPTRPE